ncbi:PAS domain S-box protein [Tanticharoenia sakaeratensis]|uniref:histidine kinase n=1 Tax=Tanticharoenia sakaeratensis NBRC 103193 TaxID=1231623 RepID=A0A0D6MLS8_9PROT|nr:PAS domain S-box protein [Tanticharoenia sakaeratensis]GAN54639.1 histidine kinase-response regulator hybrid protein [Tanticharoenia sakaeratensis NBRC 103193]GBQ16686.1 PAS domain-containing protein [Tanticharoenia sakaeratensis NBRC 103193]
MDQISPTPLDASNPLDDDLARFIADEIASGRHASARDVISHALRALRDNGQPAPAPTPPARTQPPRAASSRVPSGQAPFGQPPSSPAPWHSAEHFAVLRDSDAIGFFTRDTARDVIEGDARYAALLGIDADAMARGIPLADMVARVHPDDRADYLQVPESHTRGETRRYLRQFRIMGRDGHMLHLLARGTTQASDPTRNLGVVVDMTDLKVAETALAASEELNRRIFESSADCIKILDLDGRLLFMSEGGRTAMEIEDFSRVRNCPWLDFWNGPQRAAASRALDAARQGGTGRFQGAAPTAKGNARTWDVVVTPIRGADGRPERVLAVSRDITRLRRAERALADTETHWRSLFMSLQEGFMIGELIRDEHGRACDWRYVEANPAFGRLLGFPSEDVIGRTVKSLLPGIQDAWIEEMATVVETGHHATFLRPIMRDAARAWPIPWPNPEPARWYEGHALPTGGDRFAVLFLEITDRLRTESRQNALLGLADRLRDLEDPAAIAREASMVIAETLQVAHVGYADVQGAGDRIVITADWSEPGRPDIPRQHALRNYGSYVEDLVRGRNAVVHDTLADARTADMAPNLAAIAVRAFVNMPLMEDGRFVALLFMNAAEPRHWTEQEISFAASVAWRMRATIERRRAEARIRELATVLERAVAERTRERDSMWRLSGDLMGVLDEDRRLTAVNDAWTRTLGWSAAEVVGYDATHIVHPDQADTTAQAIAALRDPTTPASGFENRIRTRDGSYRIIAWHAAAEGGRTFLIGRDVTTQRATEDALRQAQKMEAVGQLTGGLAHDFNNLLTGITAGLELLRRKIERIPASEPSASGLLRYVDAAHGAALRAASLTHRLLAFSRRQTLDPKPVDLNRLIDGMEDLIRRTIGPTITLDVRRDETLGPILADAHQVENALLNLCINARDAMADGGRMTISTTLRPQATGTDTAGETSSSRYARLSVTDTGTGMAPDIMARAFDPFFTTKPIGRGTGLGLSMVYGFAHQSGGHTAITSTPGIGSTVSIDLPFSDGAATSDAEAVETSISSRTDADGRQILLVDDEPTIRMLAHDIAEDAGHTIRTAADADAATALLGDPAIAIDLLITDVGLPGGMNGRQLADHARTLRPNLPVLFITGYAEHTVLTANDLRPGMYLLTKPFPIQTLADKIEDILKSAPRADTTA